MSIYLVSVHKVESIVNLRFRSAGTSFFYFSTSEIANRFFHIRFTPMEEIDKIGGNVLLGTAVLNDCYSLILYYILLLNIEFIWIKIN